MIASITAHGGQQLAFWDAHHDERGFASMHIYYMASCTPVATILRPARTPKGTEVRTVIKHVRLGTQVASLCAAPISARDSPERAPKKLCRTRGGSPRGPCAGHLG
jgi:hypothetical protein